MPAKKTHTLKINLLPKDSFSESAVGKYLEWALTTGRYIVIITQAVVVLTFIQRFTLDRQLSDLNEDIFSQQSIIESFADDEFAVRQLQEKAEFIQELEKNVDVVSVLDFLDSSAPSDVNFESLNISGNKFDIVGKSFSRESLERFINTLKANPQVVDVSLNNLIQSGDSTVLEFSIGIDFSGNAELSQTDSRNNKES